MPTNTHGEHISFAKGIWTSTILQLALIVFPAFAFCQTPIDTAAEAQDAIAEASSETELPDHLAREHPLWREFEPRWTDAPCPFPPSENYDPERVDCGYVLVPENRRNPDSRLIRLSITRINSLESSPPAGTTIVLWGGPGRAVVDAAPRWSRAEEPWTSEFTQVSDLVLLDQRGIGHSEGAFCRGLRFPVDEPDPHSEQSIAKLVAWYQRCLAEGVQRGVDPTAYTTWDNAMDVRDIRRALRLDQWNLFGVSYGTELSQMVLRIDPGGVRSAVLDSVVSPPPMSWGGTAFGMARAIASLNDACSAHGACADRYGDLTELVQTAIENYRNDPLVLDDVPTEVSPSGQIVFNHRFIASGVFSALYERELYAAMPALIEAVAARDEVALRATATLFSRPVSLKFGAGMGVVAACSGFGPVSPERADELRHLEPFWFEALSNSGLYPDLCEPLGLLQADPLHGFLESDRPVLLVVGSVDPITPPAYAEYVQTGLSNSFLVEVPATGHFTTRPPCAAGIMAEFLRSPERAPDQSCLGEMEAIDFVTAYKATGAVFELYQDVDDGRYSGLIVPAIAILVLFAALLAYPIAWVGRKLDRRPSEYTNQRRMAWLAAVLLLGGALALGLAVMQTFSRSVAMLAIGLVGPTVWVAPLILLGVVIALLALIQVIRTPRDTGTVTGIAVVLGAGIALSVSLTGLGLLF